MAPPPAPADPTLTDEALVAGIRAGRRDYFGVLYDRYSGKVYHKCLSILKEPAAAKDLTHDIFVTIITKLHTYKGTSALSFWIYAVTYNACMQYLRKAKRLRFDSLDEEKSAEVEDESERLLTVKRLGDLQLDQLEQLLNTLPADEKLLLLMRYQDGLSVKQIANTLQLGQSAVKMRLKRTRDRLAVRLNQLDTDG